MKRDVTFFLFCLFSCSCLADNFLFDNGQTEYVIVLANDASQSERTAAVEMQEALRKMSGATLPIMSDGDKAMGGRKKVFIGWTAKAGATRPATSDESFTYKTIGNDLYIFGGSGKGTMYGVFSFLERELGIHWFTSSFTNIPKLKRYRLGKLSHSEQPFIQQRLDFCYDALRHNDWAAHNLLNTQNGLAKTKYGDFTAYWGMHTFSRLLPPEKYFKSHPEYYSLLKGKRSDKAQLCLSNKFVMLELTKNLIAVMKKNPGYWCYDVSQNDNRLPCECENCQKLVAKYGGQSGIMLWFVNQVADEVKKVYPDKYIGTFAYQYTRQAPKSSIRPADNVVIRLCDIECCMAHPLEKCQQNRSFLNDMNDWRHVTNKIYIWDYTTGFHNYLLPFPNFKTLAANFRYFCRSKVVGILEEGAYDAPWSEFSELKQWLIAKLLWNPYQDVDSLASVFIKGYYGKAAPYIKSYYDLCNKQVKTDTHFTIKIDWKSPLYSNAFADEALALTERAVAMVSNNSEMYRRTRRIAAQAQYLHVFRNRITSLFDGTRRKLTKTIDEDSTIVTERGRSLQNQLRIMLLN